jgi:hypothetical protein
MTNIANRLTALRFETPTAVQGRAIIIEAEPWGLNIRLKGLRKGYPISYAQVHNRAAILFAEEQRKARKSRKKEATSSVGKGEV